MPRSRILSIGLLPAIFLLACAKTPGQRGRDDLKLVVRMHRELFASHHRLVLEFGGTPAARAVRALPSWSASDLADLEGLRLSRNLLMNYLTLQSGCRDEDLPANIRLYLNRRAMAAMRRAQELEQANGLDPEPTRVAMRKACIRIAWEEYAITQRYLSCVS